MSKQYPGGIISKTAPVPSGPYADSTAPGIWTLEQQAAYAKQGNWPTQGNVNPSAFIENLFSTYLYTGTDATQTITNGIDLSGNGGLVWTKTRSATGSNWVTDSARGNYRLNTNATSAQSTTGSVTFNSNGFTVDSTFAGLYTYASWTFRKQPKFFDVVTYTGTGSAQTIAHNLGSTPGCIIVKNLDALTSWCVYHRSLGGTYVTFLNRDFASSTGYEYWANTDPTSSVFTVGNGNGTNGSGYNFVAYVFAHDAGGFGLSGTDNIISCGSFTTPSSGDATITLGYEPQWLMVKSSSNASDWYMVDNMRGFSQTSQSRLDANLATAEEVSSPPWFIPTATGFTAASGSIGGSRTFIYIAIRRGPMRVPTDPTTVFLPTSRTGNASLTTVTSGFAPDVVFARREDTLDNGNESVFADKLRGTGTLSTNTTAAEYAGGATSGLNAYLNTGVTLGINNNPIYAFNYSGLPYALYQFQRAPGFMDEVCYTGTGTSPAATPHNLTVVPEMMIVKSRSTEKWCVYHSALGATKSLFLNETSTPATSSAYWGNTAPTATNFYVSDFTFTGNSGQTYVAYLFATCAGVSKVGTYTGTGTLTTIDCGFTGGARFVLIKATSTTGNWLLWDTARGMVSGTDPTMAINTTAPEYNSNSVYSVATGFQLLASPAEAINTNGVTYIFLSIA